MTNPSYPPYAPQPAPRKSRKGLFIGLGVVVAVVLIGCIGSMAVLSEAANEASKGDKTVTGPSASGKAPAKPAGEPLPVPSKTYHVPTPAEFKLTVKELDKQCFGSAGCNLEFRISNVTYTGGPLDPDAQYEITYEFKGLEDPMLGTFVLSGDGSYSIDSSEFGQTKRSKDKVTAKVTAVEAL